MKDGALKRNVLIEKQLFPKKHWCLYFRDEDEPDLCFYDGSIGREDGTTLDGQVIITITEPNGYRVRQWERERLEGIERIGNVITVPRSKLKLGYVPNSNYAFVASRIKDIIPNQHLVGDDGIAFEIARIKNVCGDFQFIEQLNLNGGVIDADMIEASFSDDSERFPLFANEKMLWCGNHHLHQRETISPREALRRYGHRVIDEVYEKTNCGISNVVPPYDNWLRHKDSFEYGYATSQAEQIQVIREGKGFKNIFVWRM